MKVPGAPALHLTYCTNIHPGETWPEVQENIARHVVAVKARLSPDRPFGVGLRLSAAAAAELAVPATLEAFRAFLADHGLYVFTINGFPYGAFHGTTVKERVYRPDWREDERVSYSDLLAELLAALLPTGLDGSVSTVPGCFRPLAAEPGSLDAMAEHLRRHAAFLYHLRERTGRTIGLALEPEPHCILETTAEGVAFLETHLFSRESIQSFTALTGAGEEALRRHLGLCLDACHAAVEYEDPADALSVPAAAGVRIWKIQVSAGLRVNRPTLDSLLALGPFAEGVYLHQVVIRRGAALTRYVDLPQALAEVRADDPGDEWRIHFHVPLFQERLGPFFNTQPFLARLLSLVANRPPTQHLEVETYTWDVLPEEHRRIPVDDAIARELSWTLAHLA
jgi:sugar phosphate isomerase/epimerase